MIGYKVNIQKGVVFSYASSKHWGDRLHNALLDIILCNIKCLEMNIRFRNSLINRVKDYSSEDVLYLSVNNIYVNMYEGEINAY